MEHDAPEKSSSYYPTTRWTQLIDVIQRGDKDVAWVALSQFCERYRSAIYHFFRGRGYSHEKAEDYTQAFFASRILKDWQLADGFLHQARRMEGSKFRSFLAQVLWRFLQDQQKTERSQKAGGALPHVSIESLDLASHCADKESFEKFGQEFDLVFALEIIRKAAARSRHSKWLEAHLRGEVTQAEAAKELGVSEDSFKLAYHRFRERLARDLWEEVSKLAGPDETEVRAEIRYLMSLFARSGP